MKLISYLKDNHEQLGVLVDGFVYDMDVLHPDLPNSMNMFLTYWEDAYPVAQAGELMLREGTRTSNRGIAPERCQLAGTRSLSHVLSSDGYAFASMSRRRGGTGKWT